MVNGAVGAWRVFGREMQVNVGARSLSELAKQIPRYWAVTTWYSLRLDTNMTSRHKLCV